jgi:F-type H+-transporting ATPase subunit alpha
MSDAQVKGKIARGARIRAALSQPQYASLRLAHEVALVLALQEGLLDRLSLEQVATFRFELPGWLDHAARAIVDEIERSGNLEDNSRVELRATLTALVERLPSSTIPS